MWMLTKLAMVFFILALALVLTGLSSREKTGLCEARADGVVQSVRSQVSGIVSSPIEDEIKIIPLERVLATGSEDFERYNLSVTWRENAASGGTGGAAGVQTLTFEAVAASRNCRSGSFIAVPSDFKVHFNPDPADKTTSRATLVSQPSKKYSDAELPSLYLVVLKCSTKGWPPEKHLFIEDCKNSNPGSCSNFDSDEIAKCCGWTHKITDPSDPTKTVVQAVCPPELGK